MKTAIAIIGDLALVFVGLHFLDFGSADFLAKRAVRNPSISISILK
jgi:hypothetical protein